jgi:hypothetical protein
MSDNLGHSIPREEHRLIVTVNRVLGKISEHSEVERRGDLRNHAMGRFQDSSPRTVSYYIFAMYNR